MDCFPTAIRISHEQAVQLAMQVNTPFTVNDLDVRTMFIQIADNNKDAAFEICHGFMDFSLELVKRRMISSSLAMVLLEDWFDIIQVSHLSRAFALFEGALDALVARNSPDFQRNSQACLRICNRVLSRLSSSRNYELRSRILQLLANMYSVDEKSGLNLKNAFHSEKLTAFSDASNLGDIPEGQRELYSQIWSLQDYFRDPSVLSQSAKQSEVLNLIKSVLAFFESHPLPAEAFHSTGQTVTFEFPKYLTSPVIFSLQILDPNFRKTILLQSLITFQFLQGGSKKLPIQLSDQVASLVKELEEKSKTLLLKCFNMDFELTNQTLGHLDREKIWIKLKDANFNPVFSKPAMPLSSYEPASALGETDLSIIPCVKSVSWKTSDASLTASDLLEDDKIALNSREEIDTDEFSSSIQVGSKRSWKTLRQLSRTDMTTFTSILDSSSQ